jgi:GT2 family glycosyltransferase
MRSAPPFDGLPERLARRLLVGGSGPGLAPARDEALVAGARWAELADALALAVWEGVPFWPQAAALLLSRHRDRPFLPPALAGLAAAVVAAPRPPAADAYFDRLAQRRDLRKLLAYLLSRQAKAPDDPEVLYRLAVFAPMVPGNLEEVEAVFANLSGPLAPLGIFVAARLALVDGRLDAARARFGGLTESFPAQAAGQALAEVLWRQGEREPALTALAGVLRARPWDTLVLCRLHDWATGFAAARAPLPGSLAVLLYSYNSAPLLDATLAALAETDWDYAPTAGPARLLVLDNGSRDGTPEVLAAWRERLGEALGVVTLPVNIGAPAARNWLAALPEVADREFVAYLDDDALVASDWLGRFGAAVAAYPGAGVWGCRILGRDAPRFVQCADSHLFPIPREGDFGRAFDLASPWLVTPDWGQYAVCRPCSSVTGCCHLFRTSKLGAVGDFDIRFSPTQYDDLDHDLRLLLAGEVPVCQGHLAVLHAKTTGSAGNPGGAGYGSGFANQFKLHHKYDDQELARAATVAFAALARDAAVKVRGVAGLGLLDWSTGDGEGGRGR